MISIEELNNKWEALAGPETEKIRSLRINSICVPDLFIGFTPSGSRCLVLRLPERFDADFQSSVKQNLSLELYLETKWVVLTLIDDLFNDLFDDLILSIYNNIRSIEDASSYVSEFLKTYYKWSEFFQDNNNNALSDQTIKGLFGELVVLKEMIEIHPAATLNDVLDSWKGPFDTGHDFVSEHKNTEVKTKEQPAVHITISSEYQLQVEAGKTLELQVVNIVADPAGGFSLREAVLLIRDKITSKLGDYTIVLNALSQKGLTPRNLAVYDHLRYLPVSITGYNVAEDFPRLIRSNLSDAINTVNYKINLTLTDQYLIFENAVQWR
jgi:hypothetical protein